MHLRCERARQKMSRAFFTPFGKTCHMFLPVISAKDVANTSRQEVTLLPTLYPLSFPLTIRTERQAGYFFLRLQLILLSK